VHELYTVEIAVRRQVSCTGPQDVTRLVAKLENCKSDADADWYSPTTYISCQYSAGPRIGEKSYLSSIGLVS
jgi:hypothetical protein